MHSRNFVSRNLPVFYLAFRHLHILPTPIDMGHDKMRSGADLWGASLLVSFNHMIDPHFVAFSSSLYITICNPKPNLTLILTLTLTLTLTQTQK